MKNRMRNKKLLSFLLVGIMVIAPGISLVGVEKAQAATNLITNPSFETAQTTGGATVSETVTVTVAATTPSPTLTSVAITPPTPVVIIGGTVPLTATPLDQNNVPFTGATTTFTSSNSSVATVNSSSGVLTGVSAGTATITATSISGSVTVTGTTTMTVVTTPTLTRNLTSVVTVPLTPTIKTAGTVSLTATPLDQNNAPLGSGVTTTYTSNDFSIVTVNSSGVVTGVSAGTTTITVTSVSSIITLPQPQGWQSSSWGSNTAIFSYLNAPGAGHIDDQSVQVTVTGHAPGDPVNGYVAGDAKWYSSPPVAVTPSTEYTYSDWYKSGVATQVVAAFSITATADPSLFQIIGLPDPSTTPTTWTPFTTQFSIPDGFNYVTIYHLLNQNGTLTMDDVNLEPYTPVPLTNITKGLLSITFDDGYQDTYDYLNSAPTKLPNTQFIITGLINDVTDPANPTNPGYMTQAEINTLYNNGDEIASHTVTHDYLTLEPSTQWTTELGGSQSTLKSLITSPKSTNPVATDLAYPYGLYNGDIVKAVTNTPYTSARGIEDGFNDKNFSPNDIKVQNVFNTTTTSQVQDWVNQAIKTNTWLVLVYHSVALATAVPNGDSEDNTTPSDLNTELAAIKSSGIAVLPMNQALAEINGTTPPPPPSPILTSVTVTPATPSIVAGSTQTLTAAPKDQNGTAFVGATTTFSSGTPAVATVNGTTGIVTGVTAGTTTITATSVSGSTTVTGTATVTVTAATTSGGGNASGNSSGGVVVSNIVSNNSFVGGNGQGVTSGGGFLHKPFVFTPVTPITPQQIPNRNLPLGRVLGAQSFHFSLLLKSGSRGSEVMELQTFLSGAGYYSSKTDGIFGPKLRAAIIKFQIAHKIKGDGIVGSSTRRILNSAAVTVSSNSGLTIK